jgi:hypothetical protein
MKKKIFFFYFRQEKILGELSEKDSEIADLEMDRSSLGASNRANLIEKLNTEKQQLHNQLKELVKIDFFIRYFDVFIYLYSDGNSNKNNSRSYGIETRI